MSQGSLAQRSWISNVNNISSCDRGLVLEKPPYLQLRSGGVRTLLNLVEEDLIRALRSGVPTVLLAVTLGMETDL